MIRNASLKPKNPGTTPHLAATRIVRKLAKSPASLYAWVSGPAMTARERTRAEVADYRNSWARALLGD